MEVSERTVLLEGNNNHECRSSNSRLSVLFAIICIVDIFGVFPVVSLPKAIIDCGYVGILVVIIICSTQIYTAILLGKCWSMAGNIEPSIQFKNRYPYSALAELTYGNLLSKFVTFLLDLTVFGGGIPNLIVAAQNLQFLGLRLSENSFNVSFCYWMIILGALMCPFLWLGSPKDMKLLCTISVTLVILASISILTCIILDMNNGPSQTLISPKDDLSLWQNILTAYGMLTFQFDIHPTILTIQVDMKDKSKIGKAIIGGFTVSLGLFFTIYTIVVLHYETNVGPSILEMLPSTPILHFATILVALQLGLSSAISNTALYQHIEDYMGIPREFNHKRCLIRSCLAILTVVVAEAVPRFDLVMSLIGGALTGPLVFILPPLIYIKMLSLKRTHEEILQLECFRNIVYDAGETPKSLSKYMETNFYKEFDASTVNTEINIEIRNKIISVNLLEGLQILLCGVIIFVGIAATVATTYWNVINTMQFINFSSPCIFNIYNETLLLTITNN